MRRPTWKVAAAVLALGAATGAWAQAKPKPETGKKPDARKTGDGKADERKTEEKKILQFQEMEVQGKIQKPSVLSITPPPSAILGEAERDDSFIPKIVKAVEKDPF
jgi:hypothetical protein